MLKVLIIGCGNIAGGFDADIEAEELPRTHAGAYAAHGQFSMQACIEPDGSKRAAFMERWGISTGYESMEQLKVANAQGKNLTYFDVVSVCSPTSTHYDHVIQALRLSPKLIFCEKPICDDLVKAQHLVRRCSDQGVQLAVNHNRRWDPDVRKFRDELKLGKWGLVRAVMGQYNKGMLNNGSHMIDLLQDFLGPLSLIDCGKPVFDYSLSDPSIPALLVNGNGVHLTLSCGHASDYSLFELQWVTQRGVVAMEDGGLLWRTRLTTPSPHFLGYSVLAESKFSVGRYLQTTTNAVENIYHAITSGQALASTGVSALETQIICQQMFDRSMQASRT